ncbi:hypothetical protein ElyMa_003506200, partial [Elysia marginata]
MGTHAGSVSGVKNGTAIDLVIDTLIVVDDVMYDSWVSYLSPNVTDEEGISQKIREYVSFVVHQANKRLETIKHHVNISVRMSVTDIKLGQ